MAGTASDRRRNSDVRHRAGQLLPDQVHRFAQNFIHDDSGHRRNPKLLCASALWPMPRKAAWMVLITCRYAGVSRCDLMCLTYLANVSVSGMYVLLAVCRLAVVAHSAKSTAFWRHSMLASGAA